MNVELEDLLPAGTPVNLGRGELTFHGLDATQIARLLVMYKDQVMMFFGTNGTNFDALLVTAPELVIDILAASARMEAKRDSFKKIGVGKQAECLMAVYKESVPDEKKFQELLVMVLAALRSGNAKTLQFLQDRNSADSSPAGSTP